MSSKKDTRSKDTEATETPICFVVMPISDHSDYAPGHFARVFEDILKPACTAAGFKAVIASEVKQTNIIHLDILQKLLEAPMVLCDLSSRNPNVLFELGLRQAFDKPIAIIQEEGTPQIFDTNLLRYTEYRRQLDYRQVLEDQKRVTDAIVATRDAQDDPKNINSLVKLLSITHPASLTNVSDSDKEPALLQLIMSELGSLRSEVRDVVNNQHGSPFGRTMAVEHSKTQIRDNESNHDVAALTARVENALVQLSYGDTSPDLDREIREITTAFGLLKFAASTPARRDVLSQLGDRLALLHESYEQRVRAHRAKIAAAAAAAAS